jgi:hypothetical protein
MPVFIGEVHYENAGADSGKFIEITAPAGTESANYRLCLYNGSNYHAYADYSDVVIDQAGWPGTAF